jgi:hypothetical protein
VDSKSLRLVDGAKQKIEGVRITIFTVEAEMGHRSIPENLEGAVQWSNKVDTSVPQVSNKWDDHWQGQGMSFNATATSKSCIMVNVTKKAAEQRSTP